MSAVEGNHRVQGEKVTALVPRVENRIVNAKAFAEYAESCTLLSCNLISEGVQALVSPLCF
jgi:hypothetical protein